ncbi:Thymidine kinase [Streptomyces griseoloalbus]
MFELAHRAGVHAAQVSSPTFANTPLTKVALSRRHLPGKLSGEDRMDAAAAQLAAADRALVYTYYAEVDAPATASASTPTPGAASSCTWTAVQRLAEQLPPRSALYVTADHGMVDIPFDETHRIDFDEELELKAVIRSAPANARAADGRRARAPPATCWRCPARCSASSSGSPSARRGDRLGRFGPEVDERVYHRLGDVIAAARDDVLLVASSGSPGVGDGRQPRFHDPGRAAGPKHALTRRVAPGPLPKGSRPPMSELVFFCGTMDCGKSTLALQIEHNRSARCLVGMIFTRNDRAGEGKLSSRPARSPERGAVEDGADLYAHLVDHLSQGRRADYVIADEAQFLAPEQIDQLARVVDDLDLDVYAFGITTDFRSKLFPGSQRLVELADRVEVLQVEAPRRCGARATHNARTVGGVMVVEGAQVVVGDVTGSADGIGYEVRRRRRHHRRRMTAATARAAALSPDWLPVSPG